jgi:hypothetical protein
VWCHNVPATVAQVDACLAEVVELIVQATETLSREADAGVLSLAWVGPDVASLGAAASYLKRRTSNRFPFSDAPSWRFIRSISS